MSTADWLAVALLLTWVFIAWLLLENRRLRRKPVRFEIQNGFGWPQETISLRPHEKIRMESRATWPVCDRGFGSKDGKHRLVEREHVFPFHIQRFE